MNDDINPIVPDAPKFDLFATEVEDNLKEELAKGTFQWTNKYTKGLGVLLIATALVSTGVWYGHYEATKTPAISGASTLSALRAAFGGGGAGAGAGTGAGAGAAAGGFGGFGGTRITGTIKSVKGSTVTITLDDPTQASSLAPGDAARVTDTGAATATTGGTTTTTPSTSSLKPAATPAPTSSSGTTRRGAGGGVFSNPALTACLTKAGITIASGARPNFQDPKTAAALQTCFTQLGITPGGGFGGGAAPTPTATK
jgi:hypothetical protein